MKCYWFGNSTGMQTAKLVLQQLLKV